MNHNATAPKPKAEPNSRQKANSNANAKAKASAVAKRKSGQKAKLPPTKGRRGEIHADFPLVQVLGDLDAATRSFRTPALELVAAQQGDPYSVLVGTLLSLRTRDDTTLPAFQRLHRLAPAPATLATMEEAAIAEAIYPVAFFRVKAGQLKKLGALLVERHQGRVPDTMEALLALPGVGRKTANLTLSLGHGIPAVCVDVHVHRILNRLGAMHSHTPEETEALLRAHLPQTWWSRVNAVLVPFGQELCTPQSPWCSRCPVFAACKRTGVGRQR